MRGWNLGEQPKEMVENTPNEGDKPLKRWTPVTAEWGFRVTKLRRRDGLFKIAYLEKQADDCIVDLNAKTCTCKDFTQQGKCPHIEVVEMRDEIRHKKHTAQKREIYLRNRNERLEYSHEYYLKNRERICAEVMERYNSDSGRERRAKYHEKLLKEFKRFKIEFGGKCTACGEDDLDVLEPHHPHGKEDKKHSFIQSKEFRDWMNKGIKPDVILACANCHLKLDREKERLL